MQISFPCSIGILVTSVLLQCFLHVLENVLHRIQHEAKVNEVPSVNEFNETAQEQETLAFPLKLSMRNCNPLQPPTSALNNLLDQMDLTISTISD